jgi:hypothetical protein
LSFALDVNHLFPILGHLAANALYCNVASSSDGIFLGYTAQGRSYRVLNLEMNIVVESCHVTFDETAQAATSSSAGVHAS